MTKYRQIYEQNFGPIPKDEQGRSYHIHHIDGNRNNNELSNLIALSIKDHYDIHYKQKDWAACHRLSILLEMDPSVVSSLISKAHKGKSKSDSHKQNISESLKGRIMSEEHREKIRNYRLDRPSPCKGMKFGPNDKIKEHHRNRKKITCPVCGKTVDYVNYGRHNHGENCKQKRIDNG